MAGGSGGSGGSGGLSITEIAVRHSTAQSVVVVVQPAAGQLHQFNAYYESSPVSSLPNIDITMNNTNYIQNFAVFNDTEETMKDSINNANIHGAIMIGASGSLEWTTPATVGTYVIQRIGYYLK